LTTKETRNYEVRAVDGSYVTIHDVDSVSLRSVGVSFETDGDYGNPPIVLAFVPYHHLSYFGVVPDLK